MKLDEISHRRWDPLSGRWTLVSPHRVRRPWQGSIEKPPVENLPRHDPACYLCPGAQRAGGARNPNYETTFVFDNDFPALSSGEPPASSNGELRAASGGGQARLDREGLLIAEPESGVCRVVCFSPRHDLTLSQLDHATLRQVVDVWSDEDRRLRARPDIGYVQIFENRGEMMGCSNPHPHGQIWATASLPNEPARELERQREHLVRRGRKLLEEYRDLELAEAERLVCRNDRFVALTPFWAVWPFELLLLPFRPLRTFQDFDDEDREGLADLLRRVAIRYDNLFQTSFPYSMGFHSAPADDDEHPEWLFHAHFYPPLLRSAFVRKFMVGFELLGSPQRDIFPEQAAQRLREMSEVRFRS